MMDAAAARTTLAHNDARPRMDVDEHDARRGMDVDENDEAMTKPRPDTAPLDNDVAHSLQSRPLDPSPPRPVPASSLLHAPNSTSSSWSHTKSSTVVPSNPFYTSPYRPSTPPISSSPEQSPLISPAKRFSTGEVKPPFSPGSPRQPLTEEDRVKFTQLATQLKTRLTYAALKVENGWEKQTFSQIQSLLNDEKHHTSRRRSHTESSSLQPAFDHPSGKLTTYESFWASHRPQNSHSQPSSSHPQPSSHPIQTPHSQPLSTHQPSFTPPNPTRSSQPLFHATFPRRKPERLSLTGVAGGRGGIHTARDQSAAEIMIALASPRTRSEFSSPERESEQNREDRQSEGNETDDEGLTSSTRRARKRVELARDVEGLGIHA